MTDTDAREPTRIPTATTISNASSTDHALPWATLITLSFSTFAMVTVEMLPSGLLLQIGNGLGVEPAVVGGLVTAWALTIAVTSMPLVRVTRNVRRTRLLPAALAVVAAAVLAMSLAPTFEIVLAGRIVSAAAHGVFWAVIVVYVSEIVHPDRIGRALAIVLAGPAVADCWVFRSGRHWSTSWAGAASSVWHRRSWPSPRSPSHRSSPTPGGPPEAVGAPGRTSTSRARDGTAARSRRRARLWQEHWCSWDISWCSPTSR
ncbi:MFS transporter [Rhodococcus pyridinivorans]|nr:MULTISPECIES: MFS transporter [Rhodococcus]MBX4168898.1 MFS transporter [Rhodococcus sp. DMU2021]QXF82056.1 MFS transporter [Rhodococcus pyridinivorans]